jgi:cyclohexyl-isocyanide hydratase
VRWLYHLVPPSAPLVPGVSPVASEGFVHCSYRDAVRESARLYFPGVSPRVLRIDPRRIDARIEEASTPRGPMPHVHGRIDADAVREVLSLDGIDAAPDRVTGTRFVVAAFSGMTLLDLVGVCDPLARVASAAVDEDATVSVIALDGRAPFAAWGARLEVTAVRPSLGDADVLVFVGGPEARSLAPAPDVVDYVRSYPAARLVASVCTGALFLGEAGRLRGKRATTHASAMGRLAEFGAMPIPIASASASASGERVVTDGQVVTAGGVTCAVDLGLALVERIYGVEARRSVASRMQWPL